ncbi:MAG: hypothetical protein IT302_00730 [Dehalococcoidia bacterium]|nr:hypothetical protein [Dehalococcoidia bacterium]
MSRLLPAALGGAGLVAILLAALQVLPPRHANALVNCDVASGIDLDSVEQQVLALVNQARAQQNPPLAPLAANAALNRAAAWMAKDMTGRPGLSHTDSLGRDPFQRMKDCGYARTGGENIGAGSASGGLNSANAIFNAWMGSSGHRQAILYPTFTEIGIAYADGHGGRYWAMDFGYGSSSGGGGGSGVVTSTPTSPASTQTATATATATRTATPPATNTPTPTATPTPHTWRLILPMVQSE